MQVYWERLDPATIEKLIAVLLSLDNPDVQRIDGRGGDGGRDAQFRRPGGVDFYEIKSFADRIDVRRGRRAQVERSLAAAAARGPSSWTLVVPVDPTDDEEEWFDGLRGRYGFPLRWQGLTWLSGQLARHPEVARYYVEDERDAVLALLREHDAVDAAADDVSSVLARLERLKERVRLLDPHVALELTTEPLLTAVDSFPGALMFAQRPTAIGAVTVVVLPRYPGAARDSELPRMTVRFRFPDTDEGREAASAWEGIHAWGEAGTLTHQFVDVVDHAAPAGLGGELGAADLTFAPRPPDGSRRGELTCLRDGRRLASLPVSLDHLGAGTAGVSVAGADDTGSLTFRARIGPPRVSLNLSFRPSSGQLPAGILPALRLHQAARQGAQVELALDDEQEPIEFGSLADPAGEDDEQAAYLSFVEDLAVVQDLARMPFPIPASVTGADAQQVSWLARLLRDGVADDPATTGYTLTMLPGAPALDPQGFLVTEADAALELLGFTFDLGVTHTVLGPCRVEVSSAPEGPPGTTRAQVTPEQGAREVTRLGTVPAPGGRQEVSASQHRPRHERRRHGDE